MQIKTRKLTAKDKFEGMYHHQAELNGITIGYVWYDKEPDMAAMMDSYWSKILGGRNEQHVRVWRQYMGLI